MENQTRKKILYLITKSNWGGAQRYVYDLATSLPQNKYDVVVALGGNGQLVKELMNKNVRIIPLESLSRDINPFADISSFLRTISLLKKEKPDILHVNSSKAGGIGALAGRLAGISNIVFTAHGWAFFEDKSFVRNSIVWLLSWITAVLSHRVITVSLNDFDAGLKMPFVKNKMIMLHNGIKEPAFRNNGDARQILLGKNIDNAFVLGTIGELNKNKGHEYSIAAVASYIKKYPEHNIKYIIIGDGEERENLLSKIKELEIENNVLLLGFVPNASTLISGFDMFIFSSLKEGLPYVLIEAGFAKLPVVATNVGGIPEIIKPGMGILVDAKNSNELQKVIENMLKNKKEAVDMAEKLYTYVTKEFSLDSMLEKTISVYEDRNI